MMQETTQKNYKVKEQYKKVVGQIIDHIKKSEKQIDSTTAINFLSKDDTILDYLVFVDLLIEKMSSEKILPIGYQLDRFDHNKGSCLSADIPKRMHEDGPIPEEMDFEFKIFWNKDPQEFEAKQKEIIEATKKYSEKLNQEMKKLFFGKNQ